MISRAKKERATRAKRLAEIKRTYKDYPFGVLDAHIERCLERFIETGDKTNTRLP